MNRKRLIWQLPFLTLLIIGTILIVQKERNTPYQQHKGMVFGTFYNITYQCDSNLHGSILQVLQQVDSSLSTFNKSSVVSAINRNEHPVLDDMFMHVFHTAMQVSAETDGDFDITVAPLVNVWGFGFRNDTPPTPAVVDSLRQYIGYRTLEIEQTGGKHYLKKKHPETMLDFSAVAKGYGCDAVAGLLRQKGVKNLMVEIGGEVVAEGTNSKQQPWKIGVSKPIDDTLNTRQGIDTVLNVTNKAMATSGNYRNFYYKDGKKYAHTIDPKTGCPVQHSLLSATVVAPTCAMADAYATAFMVMGMEKAKRVLERHPELQVYFIYAEGDKMRTWSNGK
ncbi:MAG: FAD:protein FMN transferase [Prevotella sp.]